MKTKPKLTEEQELMKKHLKSLRKIAGWTEDELGAIIGLSKQTINGFENNPNTPLSYVQYIALLAVFEQKAKNDKNESLQAILNLLFHEKDLYNKNKEEIDDTIVMLAGAAGAAVGVGKSIGAKALLPITTALMPFLGPLGGITALIGGTTASLVGSVVLKRIKNKNDIEKLEKKNN